MTRWNRWLSALLVCALLTGLLPATSLAAPAQTDLLDTLTEAERTALFDDLLYPMSYCLGEIDCQTASDKELIGELSNSMQYPFDYKGFGATDFSMEYGPPYFVFDPDDFHAMTKQLYGRTFDLSRFVVDSIPSKEDFDAVYYINFLYENQFYLSRGALGYVGDKGIPHHLYSLSDDLYLAEFQWAYYTSQDYAQKSAVVKRNANGTWTLVRLFADEYTPTAEDLSPYMQTEELPDWLYIREHIQYAESSDYDNEIVAGFGPLLLNVLEESQADPEVFVYTLEKILNDLTQLDMNFTGVDTYKHILAQVLFCQQGQQAIQSVYTDNLAQQAVDALQTLLEDDAFQRTLPQGQAASLRSLLRAMEASAFWSKPFLEHYNAILELLSAADSGAAKNVLNDYAAPIGIGLDAAETTFRSAREVLEYVICGAAYVNTSEHFQNTLLLLAYQAQTLRWDDFPALNAPSRVYNATDFQAALMEFIDELETFQQTGAASVAGYAGTVLGKQADSFTKDTITKLSLFCSEELVKILCPLVPGLRETYLIAEIASFGLSTNLLVKEVFTGIDQRAYAADLLAKYYCLAVLMDRVVAQCAGQLTEDSFLWAARFDNAVGVYRSVLTLAADCGANYLRQCIADEEQKLGTSQQKLSWYSTALHQTAAQKLLAENIQCHAAELGQEPVFTDVTPSHWFHDSVLFAYGQGLMNGTGKGKFSPNVPTNRAMIVTILHRLEGEPAPSASNPFTDVPTGQWYTDAVVWAQANNIVGGYGGGRFGPTDPITREQMASILYKYAAYQGQDVAVQADLDSFSDQNKVSSWAKAALAWANAEGFITGRSADTIAPKGNTTRAETATILMRFLTS